MCACLRARCEQDDEGTIDAEERALGERLKDEQAAELADLNAENEMYGEIAPRRAHVVSSLLAAVFRTPLSCPARR